MKVKIINHSKIHELALIALAVFSFNTNFAQTFTDSNLPIVIVETILNPSTGLPYEIVDEPKVTATMKIIYRPDGTRNYLTDVNNASFIDYDGFIGIELRGNSSQRLDKKPYGFETRNQDGSNNNVELLGMPEENDWILNPLAFDKSLIRDHLFYQLAAEMGNYSPRVQFCEVMVNGDYRGLYLLSERLKVDGDRVDIADINDTADTFPELTGGYFTKTGRTDADDLAGWSYQTARGGVSDFVHEQPDSREVTTVQNNYLKSVFDDLSTSSETQNSSIEDGFPSIIDLPSFIDFMILNELASNVDAYHLSTYFHKDRGGKLRAGPIWDFNLTMGNDIHPTVNRSLNNVWQHDYRNGGPNFWTDLFNDPVYKCYLAKRWNHLRITDPLLTSASIEQLIDDTLAPLQEAKAREQQRWGTMTFHDLNVLSLKTWLTGRLAWMDSNIGNTTNCNFPATPDLVISSINYHPEDVGNIDEDDIEFIGITNNSSAIVNLSGVYFRALGISYQFPFNSLIQPNATIYIANDTTGFTNFYGFPPFGEYQRNLSNKSQELTLVDAYGNMIDTVTYLDDTPWPTDADGDGSYLVLSDLNSDNSLAINWSATSATLSNLDIGTEYSNFYIYPNPINRGKIYIKNTLTGSSMTEISIHNLMGQQVSNNRETLEENRVHVMDVSSLDVGIYMITLRSDVMSFTEKIIIE